MNYYPFDSRNPLYTNNIGAIASGETLRLRLLLHKDAVVYSAFACIESDDGNLKEIELEPKEWIEDYQFLTVRFNFLRDFIGIILDTKAPTDSFLYPKPKPLWEL